MLTDQPSRLNAQENVPAKSTREELKPSTRDGNADARLKKALLAAADERRKRSEAEGAVQAALSGSDHLKAMLVSAQEEIATQKATIIRLSSQATTQSTTAGFESRLQSLIAKHEQSTTKYQGELAEAQTLNASLQSLIDTLHRSSSSDKQLITDLRGEKAVLRRELDTLRVQAAAAPAKSIKEEEMKRFKDERAQWRKERTELEQQLKDAVKRAAEVELLEAELSGVRTERDTLQAALCDSAAAYRVMYRQRAMVGETYERSVRLCVEANLAIAVNKARHHEQTIDELQHRLLIVSTERDEALNDLAEIMVEREADRQQQHLLLAPNDLLHEFRIHDIAPELLALLDHAISHIDLASSHTAEHITSLHTTISSQRHELDLTHSNLSTTRTTLTALEATQQSTAGALTAAQAAHAECASQILEWRGEAARAGAQEARLRSQLCDARAELLALNERAREDRERLKRANEAGMRGGAAREAMEDELQRLRTAVQESMTWEEKYKSLSEEYDILVSRESMAVEDLERVTAQNSELIGHGNGVQKISYVDGLRREMALVKHELATTRHHLNSATDQITALTAEIESYKSIGPDLLSSTGAGRVRVTRRQPEGGEVLGASVAKRAVSGPSR